ncbi:MAG: hypothetical protein ACI8TF_002110, partial [Paracoccaceae bacterium]
MANGVGLIRLFITIGTAVQAVPKQGILVRKIPTDGQVPDL